MRGGKLFERGRGEVGTMKNWGGGVLIRGEGFGRGGSDHRFLIEG